MTGIADDLDAAQELAVEAARELVKVNPNHEILRLVGGRLWDQERIKSGAISDETLERWRKERYDRFWNKHEPWESKPLGLVQAVTWANLTVALRKLVIEETAALAARRRSHIENDAGPESG